MSRKVIGYCRVSSAEQAADGALQRQVESLERATALSEVITDTGTGTNARRPGYQRLLGLIASGQVARVVVTEGDRLNRCLQEDLSLWQLCLANDTEICDLHGRAVEFRTADGELLSVITSAVSQHRSRLYSEKTRRGLEASRAAGNPARGSVVPFGLRKLRDERGRVIGIGIDPVAGPLGRQRIEWFLGGASLAETCRLITAHHPAEHRVSSSGLRSWLRNPMLAGRRCWHLRGGTYEQVDAAPSFQGLMTDAEAEVVRKRLAASGHSAALAGRERRLLSGICSCETCGGRLAYKHAGRVTQYMRCTNARCRKCGRLVNADLPFAVLQYSLALHAAHLLPLLDQPAVDPPEVAVLQQQIGKLEAMDDPLLASAIEAKRQEIQRLRTPASKLPARALLAGLRLPSLWMQADATLNNWLRLVGVMVVVQLGARVADAKVKRVSTAAGDAPLPPNQVAIVIPGHMDSLLLAMQGDEAVGAAIEALGLRAGAA